MAPGCFGFEVLAVRYDPFWLRDRTVAEALRVWGKAGPELVPLERERQSRCREEKSQCALLQSPLGTFCS